ncbi:MAG: hypothetical protein LBU79_07240 [Planctomycetota bacterium]|jgi:hypothetical protein|nr:hypothetical protein [Planctomycetota bacterium]
MPLAQEGLIFGRYRRDDLGLPPRPHPLFKRVKQGLVLILLLVLLLGVGWFAGVAEARRHSRELESLSQRLLVAPPASRREILLRGRAALAADPGNPAAVVGLAEACLGVSSQAPRQRGYFANIARLLEGMPAGVASGSLLSFRRYILLAAVEEELGRHVAALAALSRAGHVMEGIPEGSVRRTLQLLLVNQQAYTLAVAPVGAGGDPGRALELARALLSSRDPLPDGSYASDSPAFVDTLAAAWFAAGYYPQARNTETLALGLANSDELAIYLEHYDTYHNPSRLPADSRFVAYLARPGRE